MPYGLRDERRRIFVVFADKPGERRHFWDTFTDPGFRHCWAFWPIYYPAGSLFATRWVQKLELQRSHLDCDTGFITPEQAVAQFSSAPTTMILSLDVDYGHNMRYTPDLWQSCVSVLKALLGCRAFPVFTPKQLARWMIRQGAAVVYSRAGGG